MKMDPTLIILVAMLAIAVAIAFRQGGGRLLWSGLKQTGNTFRTMWFRVLLGMTLGGFIQILVPSASVAQWLGPASGLKGILIGSYVGLFLSGGPYVVLPVIAALYHAGASPGPIIALLAGGMLAVQGLIAWDIPFLGVRLALARYIICLFLPPLIGLAGGVVFQLLNLA